MYIYQLNINVCSFISNNILITSPLISLIKIILIICTIVILLLSQQSILNKTIIEFEFQLLIILSIIGLLLLISSNNLIMFYLSIELSSLSLYILAGIKKNSELSTESSLKYFILGSLSSGLLLFGITLIYIFTGELDLINIFNLIWYHNQIEIILSLIFILITMLFKLAAAPFHMWAPDVYEGAPTIVTAFFATAPKLAILTVTINLIWFNFYNYINLFENILIFSIILSLFIGSIGALNQTKFKRLIAYSAITHVGFLLLGLLSISIYSLEATIIYIIIYIIMNLATFSIVLTTLKNTNYISELSGLSRKNLLLAISLSIILFSIAGIPPLAGFISKYFILLETINNQYIFLTILAVIASSIAIFYYIRIIKWMFFKNNNDYYIKDLNDVLKSNSSIKTNISIILGVSIFILITIIFKFDFVLNFVFEKLIYSLV